MRSSLLLIFFSAFCFLSCVYAEENPRFDLFQINESGQKKPMLTKIEGRWSWEKVAENTEALKARVIISLPEVFTLEEISSPGSSVNFKVKVKKLMVITAELSTIVNIQGKNGKVLNYELKMTNEEWPFRVEGCSKSGLNFKSSTNVLPFYVGVRCKVSGETARLQISFMGEVEIEKSNLVESQGKGESWRTYDLGNLDAAQGSIGTFSLNYKNSSYGMNLFSTKSEAPVVKPIDSKFAVGLGYDSMKFTSAVAESSDGAALFLAKALPYKVFWRFGAGFDLATVVSLKQSTNSISYFQAVPYLQFRILTSEFFSLDPRVYYSITNQAHSGTGASYQINQMGAGLKMSVQLMEGWQGQLEYRTDAIGSAVIKAHQLADLSLRSNVKNSMNWGGGVQLQTITILESPAVEYEFSQLQVYGMVIF